MSETMPEYQLDPSQAQPVDPHTALYQEIHKGIDANQMLYEYLMSGVVKMLPSSRAQQVEDALNMTCVALRKVPLDLLLLLHEFLSNYQSIVQHETAPEQADNSPFLVREEQA